MKYHMYVIFLLVLFFPSGNLVAQDLNPAEQQLFMSVTGKVMSPYCPGKLLSDCPSSKASDLKAQLRQKISQGATERDLMSYLEDQYGKSTIQSTPDVEGFAVMAWITPAIFLFLGGYIFWRWLKNWAAIPAPASFVTDGSDELSATAERAKKDLENL